MAFKVEREKAQIVCQDYKCMQAGPSESMSITQNSLLLHLSILHLIEWKLCKTWQDTMGCCLSTSQHKLYACDSLILRVFCTVVHLRHSRLLCKDTMSECVATTSPSVKVHNAAHALLCSRTFLEKPAPSCSYSLPKHAAQTFGADSISGIEGSPHKIIMHIMQTVATKYLHISQ